MIKKLSKFLLVFSLLSNLAFALEKNEIQTKMTKNINDVIKILRNNKESTKEKGEKIISIVNEIFDYEIMSKIALGKKTWLSISKEKRKEFIKLFEKKLKDSYIEKLELYTDEDVKVINLEPYMKSRLQLNTEVIGKDEIYKIAYKFYNKSNNWLIYDVDLLGVSIIQTYKQQFAGLLKEKTFEQLLETLKR